MGRQSKEEEEDRGGGAEIARIYFIVGASWWISCAWLEDFFTSRLPSCRGIERLSPSRGVARLGLSGRYAWCSYCPIHLEKQRVRLRQKCIRETPCWRVILTVAIIQRSCIFIYFLPILNTEPKKRAHFLSLQFPNNDLSLWDPPLLKPIGHHAFRRACPSAAALFPLCDCASISANDCCSYAQGSCRGRRLKPCRSFNGPAAAWYDGQQERDCCTAMDQPLPMSPPPQKKHLRIIRTKWQPSTGLQNVFFCHLPKEVMRVGPHCHPEAHAGEMLRWCLGVASS